jgi:DNA repair exonuclease SbcCD ATPase subunit
MTYHTLPDLTGYKSKAARRIGKLVEEHTEKQRELGEVGRAFEEARTGLEEARTRDTEARALAARRGDEDPGRVHEQEARARLEDLQDRLRVMERVVQDIEADLSKTLTQSKAELLEEARSKRTGAGERYTRAHREMREAHDEQRHHAGVARWALSGSPHFSPPPPDMHVLSVPSELPADDPERPINEVAGLRGA